jgi:hypothetical protein
MANRRQLIGAGLALTVLPSVGGSLGWRDSPGPAPIPVGRWLVDARFPDAVALAAHAAPAAGTTTVLDRDVLGLWHDVLLPVVTRDQGAAFGGVTTDTTLFLMRTLAADHRMRVVYRADHARPVSGVMRHRLAGSARMLSPLAAGSGLGVDWKRHFGQALGACHAAGRPVTRTVLTACDPRDPRDQTLVSWVIAPSALGARRGVAS